GPGHRAGARAHDHRAEAARLHHRHGRAEFPLRRAAVRPLLCHGARPDRRAFRSQRTSTEAGYAQRIAGRIGILSSAAPTAPHREARSHPMKLHHITAALALAGLGFAGLPAQAQGISGDVIRIGFITDMSGVYSDIDGPAGVEAIRMAIADAGGAINGKKIELVTADHQNKADIASSRAREWFDQEGLDMLVGGTNSATNLAMAAVAAEKKKPFISIGAGASDLTNAQCTPYTVHYAYDTVALARGTGSAVVKDGGKSWFFLTADYAFGHALERDTTAVVKANGGEIKGAVRAPLSTADFSSFLLQAQASGAQILGLANAGGDTINSIKAANEFGVTQTMKMAGLLVFINDVHSLGLKTTQGMYLTTGWYWDQSDAARAWAKKFEDKV